MELLRDFFREKKRRIILRKIFFFFFLGEQIIEKWFNFSTRRRIFVLDSLQCPVDNWNRMRIGACWQRVHGRGNETENELQSGCAISSFPVVISDTKHLRHPTRIIAWRCIDLSRAISAQLDPNSQNRILNGWRIWCRLDTLP